MNEEQIELYVVACQSLHRALGPFIGLRQALSVVYKLNDLKDGCTYLPVPFLAPFKIVDTPVEEAKPTLRVVKPDHGYL